MIGLSRVRIRILVVSAWDIHIQMPAAIEMDLVARCLMVKEVRQREVLW